MFKILNSIETFYLVSLFFLEEEARNETFKYSPFLYFSSITSYYGVDAREEFPRNNVQRVRKYGEFFKGNAEDDRIFYFSAIPRQMIVRLDGPL